VGVWLVGAAIPSLIVLVQTVTGRYQGLEQQAWGWLLPSFMPTLGLVIGSLVAEAKKAKQSTRMVDRFTGRLAVIVSIVYLTLLLMTLLASPLAESGPVPFLLISHLWLAPVQTIVASLLGLFFTKSH
jgi:small-conductance mechanosensitive channel